MPAVVRKIRITLQISPLSGSFTIFHLFPAFAERNSKLDFTSEGIQPCSGSGRHASWPRPCCKIRRHGLWIKLRPHRPCYGLSPIAMRAIVALLKMGLRRITYLVSANDEMNADIFGSCLCPITQTLVGLSYQKDCHKSIQCFLRSRTLNATCFLAATFFRMFWKFNLQIRSISWSSLTTNLFTQILRLRFNPRAR